MNIIMRLVQKSTHTHTHQKCNQGKTLCISSIEILCVCVQRNVGFPFPVWLPINMQSWSHDYRRYGIGHRSIHFYIFETMIFIWANWLLLASYSNDMKIDAYLINDCVLVIDLIRKTHKHSAHCTFC